MAGAAETARLIASLELDDKGFSRNADKAIAKTDQLGTSLSKIGTRAGQGVKTAVGNLAKLGAVGVGILGVGVAKGIQSLEQLDTLNRQTAAVIESTGGKAGVTAKQVSDLASSLEDLTTVDDKTVQAGENMLLTFTNIGSKTFPLAAKAMVNLGVAMAGGNADAVDLQGTAIQLGKALNDPIKGVTALSKVGVSFTQQQKDQIAAMVKAGDVAGAQAVILKELETEFGKAGEAAGTGYAADMRRFNDAIEGAEQALAIGFLPVIQKVTEWLNTKLRDPKVLSAIQDLGTKGAGILDKAFGALQNLPWDSIGNAFKLMGQGAQAAYDLFMKMPDWLKTAVLTGWGLNKLTGGALGDIVSSLATGLIKGVLGINAAVVNINAAAVNGGGGIGNVLPKAATGVGLGTAATVATVGSVVAVGLAPLVHSISESEDQRAAELKALQQAYGGTRPYDQRNPYANNPSFQKALQQPGGLAATGTVGGFGGGLSSSGTWPTVPVSDKPTAEGIDELKRINQLAANQLPQMTAKLSDKLGALGVGLNADFEAMARAYDQNGRGNIGRLEAISSQLGLSRAEFLSARYAAHGDQQALAAKLGISVDELAAIRARALEIKGSTATAADRLAAINKKDFSPTVITNVKTTFTVSARTLAQETTRYLTNAGRLGPGVQ